VYASFGPLRRLGSPHKFRKTHKFSRSGALQWIACIAVLFQKALVLIVIHGDVNPRQPTSATDELIEERDTLCAKLITLRARGPAAGSPGRPAVEAQLKQIADECGANFKVTLLNGDYVQVSPPVAAASVTVKTF
jgi:hypothetical protein